MSLDRIIAWCEGNAPLTAKAINPPAPIDRLHAAQRATGGWNWPDDALAFYAACDGFSRTPDAYVLPGYRPLPLREVVENWEGLMTAIFADGASPVFSSEEERGRHYAQLANNPTPDLDPGEPDLNFAQAGTAAGRFVSSFLPVAEDQSGSYLMVDRRAGTEFGRIFSFDKVDADINGPWWPNLQQLLATVADSLDAGSAVTGMRRIPVASGGRIVWRRGPHPRVAQVRKTRRDELMSDHQKSSPSWYHGSAETFEVLVYIAAKHGQSPNEVRRLEETDVMSLEKLLNVLAGELSEVGLDDEEKPNDVGLIIEDLIDGVSDSVYERKGDD